MVKADRIHSENVSEDLYDRGNLSLVLKEEQVRRIHVGENGVSFMEVKDSNNYLIGFNNGGIVVKWNGCERRYFGHTGPVTCIRALEYDRQIDERGQRD